MGIVQKQAAVAMGLGPASVSFSLMILLCLELGGRQSHALEDMLGLWERAFPVTDGGKLNWQLKEPERFRALCWRSDSREGEVGRENSWEVAETQPWSQCGLSAIPNDRGAHRSYAYILCFV